MGAKFKEVLTLKFVPVWALMCDAIIFTLCISPCAFTTDLLVSDHLNVFLSRLLTRQHCLGSCIYSHLGPLSLPLDGQVYCSLHYPLGRFSLSTVFRGKPLKYPQSKLTHS